MIFLLLGVDSFQRWFFATHLEKYATVKLDHETPGS